MLSAHNKFGTLSIRTVYNTIRERLGSSHELIRQLYWRDFFTYLLFHFPQTLTQSARPEYEPNPWNTSEADFQRWCTGNTGVPIIDAGMHQLNATGYIHNRVRMLTASYLVKNLHIDWRKGAQYFAQQLIDYDPALNAGNWQWISSTGYDAQPPFRTFNPDRQAKLYDSENRYINRWQ
jgi:deoxyribodipyrimidine photo-lyase